jgi:hypothetical protein
MADTNVPIPNLPEHIEETVRSIAQLHVDHHENATLLERAIDRVTAFISRLWGLGLITVIVVGWIGSESGGSSIRRSTHRSASVLMARRCSFTCIAVHSPPDLTTGSSEWPLPLCRLEASDTCRPPWS